MLKRKSIDCHIRLLYEYAGILDFIQQEKDANQIPPFAVIVEKSNLFVWYFLILGPESTAYEGGHYIGRITFSDEYPKREPIFIEMLTPTGCFKLQEPISIKQLGYKEWKPPKTAIYELLNNIVNYMVMDRKGGRLQAKIDTARNSYAYNKTLGENKEVPREVLRELVSVFEGTDLGTFSFRRSDPITPLPLPKPAQAQLNVNLSSSYISPKEEVVIDEKWHEKAMVYREQNNLSMAQKMYDTRILDNQDWDETPKQQSLVQAPKNRIMDSNSVNVPPPRSRPLLKNQSTKYQSFEPKSHLPQTRSQSLAPTTQPPPPRKQPPKSRFPQIEKNATNHLQKQYHSENDDWDSRPKSQCSEFQFQVPQNQHTSTTAAIQQQDDAHEILYTSSGCHTPTPLQVPENTERILSSGQQSEIAKLASKFNDLVVGDLVDLSSVNGDAVQIGRHIQNDLPQDSHKPEVSEEKSPPPPTNQIRFVQPKEVPALNSGSIHPSEPLIIPDPYIQSSITSTTKQFNYSGIVATPPMDKHPFVRYLVYVDRKASTFYIPASLNVEPEMKAGDLVKWRRQHIPEFGDSLEFNAAFSHEHQVWMITDFVRLNKPYETKHENGMNLIKTTTIFDYDDQGTDVQCWTRLFGNVPIKKLQTLKALPNVAYECWINIYTKESEEGFIRNNLEPSKIINIVLKVSFHSFEAVSTDERAAIWDTPWARYFDRLPTNFDDEYDEDPYNNLERNVYDKLDIITLQEGIVFGNKVVYCPKMPDAYIQFGLEPETHESWIGKRIIMDMFWNDVLDSYVVYFYKLAKGPHFGYIMNSKAEAMLLVQLNLNNHLKGFYNNPIFGHIADDKKLLGILPACNQREKIQEIGVYIVDKRLGRFARFSIGEITKEAKKMLAEAVIQNMSWYPHTILVLSGVVLSSDGITGDGKVYADDYSHLVFSLPAKFLVKCEVGMKIKFKANWTKKGATYEITEVLLVEPKKVAIEQLEVLSKEDVKPEAGPATSKFYFRVQASQSSLNPTIFEAGSFGIIEDRDFKIGLIKAVKPSVRRGVGGYNTLEIICVEDLSPSRLTYLKVVQKCEKGQTLEMVVNEAQSNQSEKENSYTWPPMPGRLNQSHCYRNNSFSDCSQPSPSFALQESEDNALTLGGNHQY